MQPGISHSELKFNKSKDPTVHLFSNVLHHNLDQTSKQFKQYSSFFFTFFIFNLFLYCIPYSTEIIILVRLLDCNS